MKITFIIIGIFIVEGIFLFKKFSGEKERIKTLFRIYRAAKERFPQATERKLLEIVAEEHIPPGRGVQLRKCGISGKQYLDGVFKSEQIDIDELIYHIIILEFPQKYKPFEVDIEEIREWNRTRKLSARDELKLVIKNLHNEFLG